MTTPWGHATACSKNGATSPLAALSGEHSCDEAISERLGEGSETLRGAEAITLEPIGEHGEVVSPKASLDGRQLAGCDTHSRRVIER